MCRTEPQVGAGCRNTYCRSVFSLRTPCPHLWGRGLGVGAREPHRSLPASGTSGGFLDPMGASAPAAFRAQAQFLRPGLVRRFPGLCFSRVTSVPRIPAKGTAAPPRSTAQPRHRAALGLPAHLRARSTPVHRMGSPGAAALPGRRSRESWRHGVGRDRRAHRGDHPGAPRTPWFRFMSARSAR